MRTEKWKKIKEILNVVLELDVSERLVLLEKLDAQMRAEVESLLAFERASADSMSLSAVEFSQGFALENKPPKTEENE